MFQLTLQFDNAYLLHTLFKVFKNRAVVVRSEHSEIMVDTDYFFDVSFKTFRLVLEPSSVEI